MAEYQALVRSWQLREATLELRRSEGIFGLSLCKLL